MDNKLIKWIWITTLSLRPSKVAALFDRFESIDEIFDKEYEDYKEAGMSEKDISILLAKDLSLAETIISKLKEIGAYAVCIEDENYPKRLKAIPNPPYVLYVRGSMPLNSDTLNIGVVGTRNCTEYGECVTAKISYELARTGFTIVSGMARGVDTFAAISALRAGAKTIAVLGGGVDIVYPPENNKVMEKIIENGVVISEYAPMTRPMPMHFPERNRIIAGLCDALIVTEAPAKSGSLITARFAYETGKKIFAVPGSIFSKESVGANNLIKAGMYAVTHPNDIISEFSLELQSIPKPEIITPVYVEYPKLRKKKNKTIQDAINQYEKKIKESSESKENSETKIDINDSQFSVLSNEEKEIVKILIEKDRETVDEIIRVSGYPAAKVNSMLSLLEITGTVKRLAGNYYELVIEE